MVWEFGADSMRKLLNVPAGTGVGVALRIKIGTQ